MNDKELAKLFNVNPITIWRWKSFGASARAKQTAKLLHEVGKLSEIPEYLK